MKCDGCRTVTPAQAHCSVCHRTFGGVSGFDEHRRGGVCVDPATLGFVERAGIWRWPPDERSSARWSAPSASGDAPWTAE